MTALTQAVAIGDNELRIDTALAAGQVPGFVQIDDELLSVGGQNNTTGLILSLSSPAREAHDNGATVTYAGRPYDPTFKMALAGGATEQTIYSITKTLTDAQTKAAPVTPVEVLPAPGADKVILPIAAYLIAHDPDYTGYTNQDATIAAGLRWRDGGGASDPIVYRTLDAGNFFDGNYPRTVVPLFVTHAVTGSVVLPQVLGWDDAPGVNASLEFYMTNGAAGALTGGDAANTLDVLVLYTVIDV